MSKVKRKWDIFTDERKQKILKEIVSFFQEERGEEIGVIAAELILDFFLKEIGPDFHRKGVEDARAALKQRLEDLDVDLDVLTENK